MTTDLSKKQLTTILSALDDAPRNPANKGEALRAIGRSAQRFGLTTEDVLAAAPGLLDGRLRPAEFRVELHDLAGTEPQEDAPFVEVTGTPQAAAEARGLAGTDQEPTAAQTAPEPAQAPAAAGTAAAQEANAGKPRTPREGTKQAHMVAMLQRPEGATVDEIVAATSWQKHTVRGAISGALKKKLGLEVTSEKIEGRGRVYRVAYPS